MADPLSVAASVLGLATVAVQVSTTIGNIINRARKAPKEISAVKLEVDTIHTILEQLQGFVLGTASASRSRTSLILINQMVAIISACVITFSELDAFTESLQSGDNMDLMDRFRWMSKSKDLSEILTNLQMHKNSLNLMVMILTW